MLRRIHIALITILLAYSGAASATLNILEQVAEADAANTTLPRSTAGQVVVRQCNGCKPSVWRVNAATSYYVGMDTQPVALADLLAAATSGQQEMVYVFFKPDTNEVTRIVLSLRD